MRTAFPVPLIVDFDEQNHRFVYDEKFAFKNPDWTYNVVPAAEQPALLWRQIDLPHEINELESSRILEVREPNGEDLGQRGEPSRGSDVDESWSTTQRT